MDECDIANDLADAERERALRQIRPMPLSAGIGVCLNCGDGIPDQRRWCCVECRNDWERYVSQKA